MSVHAISDVGGRTLARTWFVLVAIVVMLAGACGDAAPPTHSTDRTSTTEARAIERDPARSDQPYIAVIVPTEAADIKAKESGDLIAVHVRPGDRVSTGDLIAELDLTPVREALLEARARLRSARATLGGATVSVEAAESALRVEKDLFEKGIGARKNLEEAEFKVASARKARESAAADVQIVEAQVETLQRRFGEARITAPIDGAVSQRYRDPGTAIAAGDLLLRIIRVDQFRVRFAVPSSAIERISVGDLVHVDIESTSQRLSATVKHKAPELDPAGQMFFIDAQLDVPDDQRETSLAGLSAWVVPVSRDTPPARE